MREQHSGAERLIRLYEGKTVLITGGTGFLGVNFADSLVRRGAHVTLFTDVIPANWQEALDFNHDVRVVTADIRDPDAVGREVEDKDYIFAFAGLSGAAESNERPFLDLDVNCAGLLQVLESCRKRSPTARVFFPSSQLVYGAVTENPVTEEHRTDPTSLYGIHKLAGEKYCQLYHRLYGVRTSLLRIPNPFGPRQAFGHRYGIVNYFISRVLIGKPILIYGSGEQLRDFMYIGDLVDAALLVAGSDLACGNVYNVGGRAPSTLAAMAAEAVRVAGRGSVEHVSWPEDCSRTEVGDMFLSKDKIGDELGWRPRTSLFEGLRRTIDYYKRMTP